MFCLALMGLCGCNVENMSSLTEISKPYVGIYECEELSIGGVEQREAYKKLKLELDAEGRFALTYATTEGQKGEYHGHYKIDPENEEITFYSYAARRSHTFVFPMKNGSISIDYNLGGKLLHGVFKLP